jgi:hypothetical protein
MKNLLTVIILFTLLTAEPHPEAIKSAHEIIQVFSNQSSKSHISDDLRTIARYGHSLSHETKEELRLIGFNFDGRIVNRSLDDRTEASGLNNTYDSGNFRFHYTTSGSHAVSSSDTNSNSIPDYIEQMSDVFNHVVDYQLNTLDFVEPPADGWYTAINDNGGNGLYDIYVRNAGAGLYGYVQPELYANNNGNNEHSSGVTEVNAFTSYMVMRHNYNGFPNTELEAIQVTAAHEFFHAVQFGYDGWEESWVMEASAVEMEEYIYDDINDCYQYMSSWFSQPHKSLNLDSDSRWYGSFIYFQYVAEHVSEDIMKSFWQQSITHDSYYGNYSIQTLDEALGQSFHTFSQVLNNMSVANRIMSSSNAAGIYSYDEGETYTISGPSTFQTVSYSAGTAQDITSTNLQENAAQYIRLISDDPVLATLTNDDGPDSYLELNVIVTYGDSSWTVWSGSPLNVNPAGASNVYFVVVSQNDAGSDFDYTLSFADGELSTDPELPKQFSVSNAYPNPFNPQTHFQIELDISENVSAFIYDVNGRLVKTLFNNQLNAGQHTLIWDGLDGNGNPVASGTYFVRLKGVQQENWQKVTLLK